MSILARFPCHTFAFGIFDVLHDRIHLGFLKSFSTPTEISNLMDLTGQTLLPFIPNCALEDVTFFIFGQDDFARPVETMLTSVRLS